MDKIINKKFIQDIFPDRAEDVHKGSFGRILNIAGSEEYIGAAYLSSASALRAGAGFVRLACSEKITNAIASMAPEITFIPLKTDSFYEIQNEFEKSDIVSLGCGLSINTKLECFVSDILNNKKEKQNFVLDADGINILAKLNLDILLKNSIMTPHYKELSRLLKVDIKEIIDNKEKYARITAKKYDCIVVLKGHTTIITDGEDIYTNTTNTSALAKAGSGDVLTGIISGFLSQKLSPLNAAITAVYLHGLTGDIAAEDLTSYSVLASDLINYIPAAINEILSEE